MDRTILEQVRNEVPNEVGMASLAGGRDLNKIKLHKLSSCHQATCFDSEIGI